MNPCICLCYVCSLGEGCTHVAGLLFALEGRLFTDADVPYTSKPCEWNRRSKKKRKDTKPVRDLSLKKIKLSGENVKNKKTVNYKVYSIKFRSSLCAKLGNNSRAAIFFSFFHRVLITILMYKVTLILLILKK